jgi:hypothetical protein
VGATYHASPSLILTLPKLVLGWEVLADSAFDSGDGVAPIPLMSTLRFIAAIADDDKSLAITYLDRRVNRKPLTKLKKSLTSQVEFPLHNGWTVNQ